MEQRSSLYRLIEKQLDGSLADYVAARRPALSWRTIADELADRIGVEVNRESLRLWFGDDEPTAGTRPGGGAGSGPGGGSGTGPLTPSVPVPAPKPPGPQPPSKGAASERAA